MLPYINGQISEDRMTENTEADINPRRQAVIDLAEHFDIKPLLMDGFDDAIIGTTMSVHDLRVVYSYHKMVDVLMVRDGMSEDEAMEFIDYNCQMTFDSCPLIMDDLIF